MWLPAIDPKHQLPQAMGYEQSSLRTGTTGTGLSFFFLLILFKFLLDIKILTIGSCSYFFHAIHADGSHLSQSYQLSITVRLVHIVKKNLQHIHAIFLKSGSFLKFKHKSGSFMLRTPLKKDCNFHLTNYIMNIRCKPV
jgi:hypothetical protein